MPQELPIATGYYVSSSLPVAAQRCTNMYVNIPETEGYTKAQLFQTPGIDLILNTGESERNRGAHVMGGVPYFVNGQKLYRLDRNITVDGIESFTATNLGAIEGADYVSMADNGNQLCIVVPGIKGYIYTASSGVLAAITSAAYYDLGPSEQVVYVDGYFVHQAAKNVFNSDLNDGLTYSGLDFAEAEADPDDITAIHVSRSQLFIGGSETTEVWQNQGLLTGFPFQRIQGFVLPIGMKAKNSVVNMSNSFAFIGSDIGGQASVYQYDGNNFQKISTGAIEFLLLKYNAEQIAGIIGFSYSQNGAVFAGWILPDTCIVYDQKASLLAQKPVWHERKSFISSEETRWRANCVAQAYNRFFVGDYRSGRIGVLSIDVYTEFSEYIRRRWTAGPFNNAGGATYWNSVQLIVESGTATVGDRAPSIDMSYSNDGGKTFGSEITRTIGKIGEYTHYPTWNRLGLCRNARIYQFDYADDAKLSVIGLIGDFDGGR
jgi:hypothetical protein